MDTWPGQPIRSEGEAENTFSFSGQILRKGDKFWIILSDGITLAQVILLEITKEPSGTVIALLEDNEMPLVRYSINANGYIIGGGRVYFNSKP